MLGVHWPTDCLIGLAIGLISSLVLLPRLMALYEDEEKRCTTCLVAAPVLAVVALVPCILIQLGIIEEIDGKDLMKIAALSSGAMAGVLLETRKAGFKEACGLKRRILNSLICLAGAGIIMVADSLVPAPVDAVGSLILHLLLGYFASQHGCSLGEAKIDFYKRTCNRDLFERRAVNRQGREVTYLRSSAELTTGEMTLSIDRFRNWSAAVAGIYLPAANEQQMLIYAQQEIERNKEFI